MSSNPPWSWFKAHRFAKVCKIRKKISLDLGLLLWFGFEIMMKQDMENILLRFMLLQNDIYSLCSVKCINCWSYTLLNYCWIKRLNYLIKMSTLMIHEFFILMVLNKFFPKINLIIGLFRIFFYWLLLNLFYFNCVLVK